MSSSTGDVRPVVIDDVDEDWPNFFPPGVRPPVGVSALSLLAPAQVHPRQSEPTDAWLSDALRIALEVAGGFPAYQVVVECGRIRPYWLKRGFWAAHSLLPEGGARGPTAVHTRDGWTQWAGLVELWSVETLSQTLVLKPDRAARPVLLGAGNTDLLGALTQLVESPRMPNLDYPIHFMVPELIQAVVASGALVVRRWTGAAPSVDIFGPKTFAGEAATRYVS